MFKRKWMAMALAIVLVAALFSGCGAASMESGAVMDRVDFNGFDDGIYDSVDTMAPESAGNKPQSNTEQSTASTNVQNQKLVRTMDVEAETDDLDALLADLDARIKAMGGYWGNKSIRNGSNYNKSKQYRTADLTIRIPVENLDSFISHVEGATNIVTYRENTDDITLRYVATASRIAALETEQARLLELLAQAENMSDLLMIEQRLTEVRAELEQYTSQKRLYDNMVDFATVNLSVTQVQEYTVVEEETIWQRMGSGLKESWEDLCEFTEDLLVLLVTSLPFLIPIALIGLLIFVVIKLAEKPRRKKMPPQQPPTVM